MVDKNSNIVEQFYISFLRLNLGGSVRGGLGLIILVLKFGWKSNILSKKDRHRRKNVFPYRGVTGATCWVGQKVEGLFSTLFALLLGRIISSYFLCLYFLYIDSSKVGIYVFCYKKYIKCFEFLTVSIQDTLFFISTRLSVYAWFYIIILVGEKGPVFYPC